MSERDTTGSSFLDGTGRFRKVQIGLIILIALVLTGWALHFTASVFVPLVFGAFLALLVAPIDRAVQDRVSGRWSWLGHTAAMATVLAVLLVFLGALGLATQQVVERFPSTIGEQGMQLLEGQGESGQGQGGPGQSGQNRGGQEQDGQAQEDQVDRPEQAAQRDQAQQLLLGSEQDPDAQPSDRQTAQSDAGEGGQGAAAAGDTSLRQMASRAIDSFGSTILGQVSGIVKAVVTTTGSVLAGIVLVFFLTLLMLIEAPLWRKKLSSIASSYTAQDTEDTLNVVAYRLRRYLLTRTVLGLLTALLYVLWLWIFGVDLLLVWFLLTFLLNYIPTIGSLISGGLAIIYAYVQKDFGSATLVAAGLLAIEQIMGNYIDPRVQGRQVSVSPLIILFVLLLWGWIWGVAGALLAVPITIAVIIISAHVAPLRPLGLLLSNEKDMDGLDRIAQPDAQKD